MRPEPSAKAATQCAGGERPAIFGNVRSVRLGFPPWWDWALVAVALACFGVMFAQRRIGLSLHDEGFLWYGAQRMLLGELPLRDYQSYDPGRYFWAAAWMALSGNDGIITLRVANAALAAITVALATWIVTSHLVGRKTAVRLAVGAIFTLWMQPHMKAADSFAAVLLLFGLSRLISRPEISRYFQAGVCLGVAAMIGINHALYGTIAGMLAFAYVRATPNPARAFGAVIMGGVIGYAPVLALDALAPGFAPAFLDSIVRIFEAGTTNLSLSYPDPLAFVRGPTRWHVWSAARSLLGIFMAVLPLAWLWAIFRLRKVEVRLAASPVALAGLMLALPYAHYVASRMDLYHAAVSALPVLAVMMTTVFRSAHRFAKWLGIAALFGVSIIMTARSHPAYEVWKGPPMKTLKIDDADLLVAPRDVVEIDAARTVARLAGRAQFVAAPYLPGAYALARRKSPLWEIYLLFPSSPERQEAEIARLRGANVSYALLSTGSVDNRPDLGLRNTHSLLLIELQRRLKRSMTLKGSDMAIRSAVPDDPLEAPKRSTNTVAPGGGT